MGMYKGFEINTVTSPDPSIKPFGAREVAAWRALIDTTVADTLQGTSATSGHYHNKLYATSGGVVALSANASNSTIIHNRNITIGSTTSASRVFIDKDINGDPYNGFAMCVQSLAVGNYYAPVTVFTSGVPVITLQGHGILSGTSVDQSYGYFDILPIISSANGGANKNYCGTLYIHAVAFPSSYVNACVELYSAPTGGGYNQYMQPHYGTTSIFVVDYFAGQNALVLEIGYESSVFSSSSIRLYNNYYGQNFDISYKFEGIII